MGDRAGETREKVQRYKVEWRGKWMFFNVVSPHEAMAAAYQRLLREAARKAELPHPTLASLEAFEESARVRPSLRY